MTRQARACITDNVTPQTNPIAIHRFVGWNHEQLGANGNCMAASQEAIGVGENGRCTISLTAVIEAGAAIDGTEQRLKSDADGRAVPWAAGSDVTAGILVPGQTAAAAGDLVEVYIIQSVAAA